MGNGTDPTWLRERAALSKWEIAKENLRVAEARIAELESTVAQLREAGDLLQSSCSRLVEWVSEQQRDPPYEVQMAAVEGRSAVEDWTAIRTQTPDDGGRDGSD